MSYGPKQVFTTCIASGASTSSYIDMGDKTFTRMAVKYVTMSTGCVVTVYGCESASGTYLPVNERVNTSSVQYQNLTVATNVSGGWGVFDCPPFRYLQLVTTAVVSGGVSFTVIAGD